MAFETYSASSCEYGSDFVAGSSYTCCTVSCVLSNGTGSAADLMVKIYTNGATTIGSSGTVIASGTLSIPSIPNARSTNSCALSANIVAGGTYTLSVQSPLVPVTAFLGNNFSGTGTYLSVDGGAAVQMTGYKMEIQTQTSP
jgi:hypothetical protein